MYCSLLYCYVASTLITRFYVEGAQLTFPRLLLGSTILPSILSPPGPLKEPSGIPRAPKNVVWKELPWMIFSVRFKEHVSSKILP